jgi:N-methylhydantoinase B
VVNPGTPDERVIVHSHEAVPVKAGDVVRILTPGGGGWGDALARIPEAVRLDVVRGIVSPDRAQADYGVVLDRSQDPRRTYEVDESATRELRRELREDRPPLKMINRGDYAERLIAEGRITVSDHDMPAEFDEQAYLRACGQISS